MTRRAVAGIAGAAGLIALVTLITRVVGFGRWLVFADAVRAGGVGDVYNTVNAVPNVLYEIAAGGVLAAVVVPVVAGHLGRGSPERANAAASAMLTWVLVVLVPLALLLALAAGPLAALLLEEGARPGAREVGATMLRVFAVQVPLYGIGVVLAGVLQSHRRFLAAALAPLASSLVVIAAYLAYGSLAGGRTWAVPDSALRVLAWGTTAGVVALSLPLAIPAHRAGFRWRPSLRFPDGDARRSLALAGAGLLALAAQQVGLLVTIWVANHRGGSGSLTVYQYVQAVYLLPYAVLAVPLATAAFPSLAGGAAQADRGSAATLARSLRGVLLLSGLGAAVLFAVARPVQEFFVVLDARRGGGRPSGEALTALAGGLGAASPGLVGFGVSALLLRALYVRGRPIQAAGALALGWVVAGVAPWVMLAPGAGPHATLRTIGYASSLGMTLAGVVLAVLAWRSWGGAALAGAGRLLGVVVVALAVAIAAGDLVVSGWPPTGLGGAVMSGVLTALVVVVAYLAVVAVADRESVIGAIQRGRARRRGAR